MKSFCVLYSMMNNLANGILDRFMILVPDCRKPEKQEEVVKAAKRNAKCKVTLVDLYQVIELVEEGQCFRPTTLAQKYVFKIFWIVIVFLDTICVL